MPSGRGLAVFLTLSCDAQSVPSNERLLQFHTAMSMVEARSGMVVQADTVYIIPPAQEAHLRENNLILDAARPASVDGLLQSLALDQRERAIAVILAGVGPEVFQGMKRIKEEGGLVIMEEAEPGYGTKATEPFDVKIADLVSRPLDIPQHILHWINNQGRLVPDSEPIAAPSTGAELQKIVSLLRAHSGHDFTLYKKNTLRRRIERRMIAQKVDSLSNYIRLLETETLERERLLKEILIGVTSFFRDPEAYDVFKTVVIPQLLQNVMQDGSLRIWIPGCSTGEEVYSIAICLMEACESLASNIDLRIFASDIDKDAIDIAREGRYPKSIAAEISAERLKNFFYEGVHEYKVKPEIKERIIFAVHNVVRDPPFSKVNLISCRNLMIYLEPVLQQKLLRIFHYALNPGGFLFLGSSETTGDASSLFLPIDKKWKFFERKSSGSFPSRPMDFEAKQNHRPIPRERAQADLPIQRRPSIRELSQGFLMASYVPPSLICDSAGDILFVHGRMSDFLETAQGEAHMNVFTMARDEIKLELSRCFQRVLGHHEPVRFKDLKITRHNDLLSIDLVVRPAMESSFHQRLIVVSFEATHSEPLTAENVIQLDQHRIDEHTQNLERDLLFTREHMQALVEQLETSNEELKSMNEELQSSNEELQSSNEELETAKEELQAVNEELVTLNTELQIKIEELSTANNDLDNFLSSSSIATIFLNRYLLITRYSRSATKIFNLIPSDIGRSLGDFATQMKYDRVLQDAEEVLNILAPIERIVELKDNRTLFMRITPYKTAENVIDGVVIGFSDITEQNRLEKCAAMYRAVCEKIPSGLLVVDQNGKVVFANQEFCKHLNMRPSDVHTSTLNELSIQGIPEQVNRSWTGKIRLQGRREHAMTAEASISEINFLLAMPHYLLIVHKVESNA
jgi:two-component system CheB/CheR fusion protein